MVALSSARPVAADPKRDAPDYDGRGNTDTDAGSWALWIPRLALSLQIHAETNIDVRNDRSWIAYGAILGAAVDLQSRQRTVKIELAVDYVDPLRGSVVPFNEQASLGGSLMPGFVTGWMTGRSTVAAQVGYSWPVWMWLDGQARFSMGNAFGSQLDGFTGDKLRLAADLGVISIGKRDQGLEVLFGVGTENLEQGAGITSVRLSFGSRKGF